MGPTHSEGFLQIRPPSILFAFRVSTQPCPPPGRVILLLCQCPELREEEEAKHTPFLPLTEDTLMLPWGHCARCPATTRVPGETDPAAHRGEMETHTHSKNQGHVSPLFLQSGSSCSGSQSHSTPNGSGCPQQAQWAPSELPSGSLSAPAQRG